MSANIQTLEFDLSRLPVVRPVERCQEGGGPVVGTRETYQDSIRAFHLVSPDSVSALGWRDGH